MSPEDKNENRKFTRVEWISNCTVVKKSVSYSAKIINISATGFFIECRECDVEIDEEVFINIDIQEYGISNIGEYKCAVKRILDNGFAVHIFESDFYFYNKLLTIISENSEDAAIIKKEIANSSDFVKMWKGIEVNKFG
jgi:hypothetical protein